MKAVYLHIGLPKTGTTGFQNWLERNSYALRQRGLFTFSRVEFAHRLAVEAIQNAERKAEADIAAVLTFQLSTVLEELKAAAKNEDITRIVISSEYFTIADAPTIKRILLELGINEATVIVTLRRQDRFIESTYSQEVLLMGRTEPLGEPHYGEWYDWYLLVSSWANAFDRKIKVLAYDRLIAEGRSVNKEIIKIIDGRLGGPAPGNLGLDDKTNVSAPAKLLEFKRLANRAGSPEFHSLITHAIENNIDDTKFRMNPQKAKGYMKFYRRSNRRVAREFLGVDKDLFNQSDLDSVRGGEDYTGRLPIEMLVMLFALFVRKDMENIRQFGGPHGHDEIRGLIELVKERDRQLLEADGALRNLLQQAEERDRRLMEADSTIRQLLRQVEERNRQLEEAGSTIGELLRQAEERNHRLVEADSTLRQLLRKIEERDHRLTEADGTIRQLLRKAK